MMQETEKTLYLFQHNVDSPKPIRQDWYVSREGRKVMREAVGHGAFSTENIVDWVSGKRLGPVRGGGYSRNIVYEQNGKGTLFTHLYPRITGDSKEKFIDSLVKEGENAPTAFPSVVIDTETGLYFSWGEVELGHIGFQDNKIKIRGVSKAGFHTDENLIGCGNHSGSVFAEIEGTVNIWDGSMRAHFDFASPNPSSIISKILKVISYPDFDEEKLRSLIDVTLVVQ